MTKEEKIKWKYDDIEKLFNIPFNELIFKSASIHRKHHEHNKIQVSTLLSIKTGSCPENCKYCPQSAHYNTSLKKEPLMEKKEILKKAKLAKEAGATRFCMGAAWRKLHDKDVDNICDIISEVKNIGIETCVTLGMVNKEQVIKLRESGLDYYNHNIDTSPDYYKKIISTRKFEDRIETLNNIQDSDISLCCGGIIGMGEKMEDRIKMLLILSNLKKPPKSIPLNKLIKIKGTPLYETKDIDDFDFIKMIAVIRILIPRSVIRLSAGRENMSEQTQAFCFLAGANSIFYGDKLLTTKNPDTEKDDQLLKKLGIEKMK